MHFHMKELALFFFFANSDQLYKINNNFSVLGTELGKRIHLDQQKITIVLKRRIPKTKCSVLHFYELFISA